MIANARTRSYLVVGGPNRDVWNVLLGCFDFLVFPAILCIMYASVGLAQGWLYKQR